ncbi:MAG: hypothetical protein NW207_07200 [Cytophagales bacterium]|nr:hypothetical protein [Cytophagales bacterium]
MAKYKYEIIFLYIYVIITSLSCVSDSTLPPAPVNKDKEQKNTPLNLIPGNNVFVATFGGMTARGNNNITPYVPQSGRCDTSSGKYAMSLMLSSTLTGGSVDLAGVNIILAAKPTSSKSYTIVPNTATLYDTSAHVNVTFKISGKAWRGKSGKVQINVSAIGTPSAILDKIAIENMSNLSDTTLTSIDFSMVCQ